MRLNENIIDRTATFPRWKKITTSKTPTWLKSETTEGFELRGSEIMAFRIEGMDRIYEPAHNLDVIDMMRRLYEIQKDDPMPAPDIRNTGTGTNGENQTTGTERTVHGDAELVQPAAKTPMSIGTGMALAAQYGIPSELAGMFFTTINGAMYIKNPGLLWLAAKKGYGHIEMACTFNETTKEWDAQCWIYPVLDHEMVRAISLLSPAVQEGALHEATMPTNGMGSAGSQTIKVKNMLIFAKELAQTRAQNRALRAYTGYGGTSYEELADYKNEKMEDIT